MSTLNERCCPDAGDRGFINLRVSETVRRGFGVLSPAGGRPDPACASAYQDGSHRVKSTCWCGHAAQPVFGNIALDGYID